MSSELSRRDALKLLALMAAAPTFSFGCRPEEIHQAHQRQGQTQPSPDRKPQFFTEHEYRTITVLADWIIPADERSGSASDAGVPAFIDYIMTDPLIPGLERRQTAIRGGLAWLDYHCLKRYGEPFVACTPSQQQEMLEQIAYPEVAPPEMQPGVAFFNSLRDRPGCLGFLDQPDGDGRLRLQGQHCRSRMDGMSGRSAGPLEAWLTCLGNSPRRVLLWKS